MDAVTFVKELNRMCRDYMDCRGCPLDNICIEITEKSYPEEAVAIVEKWSQEHPRKTMLQDFIEKYPNAPLDSDGMPRYTCPYHIGLNQRPCNSDCAYCWNRPLTDK